LDLRAAALGEVVVDHNFLEGKHEPCEKYRGEKRTLFYIYYVAFDFIDFQLKRSIEHRETCSSSGILCHMAGFYIVDNMIDVSLSWR
jgi:hypothetical protein